MYNHTWRILHIHNINPPAGRPYSVILLLLYYIKHTLSRRRYKWYTSLWAACDCRSVRGGFPRLRFMVFEAYKGYLHRLYISVQGGFHAHNNSVTIIIIIIIIIRCNSVGPQVTAATCEYSNNNIIIYSAHVCVGKRKEKNLRSSVLLLMIVISSTTIILYYNIKSRLKRDRTTRATFFFRQSPSKRITDSTIKHINYYNIIGTFRRP